jgi:hypothetical protein
MIPIRMSLTESDIAEALWASWDSKQRLRWWISKWLGRNYQVEVGEPALWPGARKETLAMQVRAAQAEYTRRRADPPPPLETPVPSAEAAQ